MINETLSSKLYKMSMYIDFTSHKRKNTFMFCFIALHPRNQISIFHMKAPLKKYTFTRKEVIKRRLSLLTF